MYCVIAISVLHTRTHMQVERHLSHAMMQVLRGAWTLVLHTNAHIVKRISCLFLNSCFCFACFAAQNY
jgi:hypothetical protein